MQLQHGCLGFSFDNQVGDIQCVLYGDTYQFALFAAWVIQYEIDHFRPLARVPDTYTQSPEVPAAEVRDDVFQAIMSTMSATQLQAGGTRLQIKFIMYHQDFRWSNLVELCQCAGRSSTGIHEGLRLEQQYFMAVQLATRHQAVELRLTPEVQALQTREFVRPPVAGIMAGSFIFTPGIAQANDQTY